MIKRLKALICFTFLTIGLVVVALCNINQVSANTNYLTFNDGIAKLGRYPQTITDLDVELIKSGKYNDKTGWYEYDNNEYAIITVDIDTDYQDNECFNNGELAKNYKGV